MPRLFVIRAEVHPVAVVLRRGPSRWYHIIRWDMQHDVFTHGAWIRGRIYEQSCDLSPDGNLFVYSVMQGSRSGTGFSHCWTAISRAPWLQALVLWPFGTTYGGGGRFISDRELVLRGVWHSADAETHPDYPLRGVQLVKGDAEPHRSAGDVEAADWSGRDHDGCVIFTRGGKLFRRSGGDERLLADWTDLKPDPQPAPDWATRPLG